MRVDYAKEYDNVLDELMDRGYFDNTTDEEALRKLLSQPPCHFYIGFDATADSLTVGHFIQIMVMMRMQAYGHVPVALLGGGTTLIGDPSGRSDMRSIMTEERIDHNASCFFKQLSRFLDFSDDKAMVLNNKDWLLNLNYLNFMREIGVHFNVGEMVKKDAYRNRLESGGLSFFEFGYMLLQSYDFLELYRRLDCRLQLGGSDQWANIIGGVDLVRKVEDAQVFGMTFKLLTTADGVKMGKSMKGAVWLDEDKTSPYDLFQYMRNVDDRDVTKFLLQLTFLPKARCLELGSYKDERINEGKEVLAYEVTKIIHGQDKADAALAASRSLFSKGRDHADMPGIVLSLNDPELFGAGADTDAGSLGKIGYLTLLTKAGLTASNAEARRLIKQGGISIDDEKVSDPQGSIDVARLKEGITVRKGKKVYLKITAE